MQIMFIDTLRRPHGLEYLIRAYGRVLRAPTTDTIRRIPCHEANATSGADVFGALQADSWSSLEAHAA
jgi:hypothetical protein